MKKMVGKNLKISILSYFFVSFVLDGLQRLSGLFVLELLHSTNVSRQNASLPFIFCWVVSNIIAAFSAFLTDNKMSQYVILFGVLLSAAGAALCILATNITILTIFWGLIFGSGHGLVSPHLFNYLNNRNFSKQSFILQVSPSLGVAFMAFVLSVLNSYYGLQGSFLIFCGIILNYLPLALAAAYNIKIYIPSIKWRVRKKSKQYAVSKQDENEVSVENFVNSLEPDLILKMHKNDKSLEKATENESELFTGVVLVPTGRKRSETRNSDLQGLDMEKIIFPRNKSHSQTVVEKGRNVFEGNFNNKDIVHDRIQYTDPKNAYNINSYMINNIKILEKVILNAEMESDVNLKAKTLPKIYECENDETTSENKKIENSLENYIENSTDLAHTCVVPENTTLQNLDSHENGNILQNDETGKGISPRTLKEKLQHQQITNINSKKLQTIKPPERENLELSPQHLKNKSALHLPLDIKVHVEEYILKTDEEDWEENLNSKYLKVRTNTHKNHSNSLVLGTHEDIDFCNQNFSKNFLKCPEFQKPVVLSSLYSISEKCELDIIPTEKNTKEENKITMTKQILNFLNEISSRVCLCILLMKIIFEINLVTLLTMFADFGNDVNATSDFKWILVAFGIGGLIGKFSCKLSKTIPEKCHAIGVVLFLLNGLATAGVLYSSNLNWLASFYCILGALEGGITYIIPKFILEYVDENAHFALFFVKRLLSGAAISCIPYVIGLFRDEMGDYEFLLQILSCSSILCAFLAYFLPYLRTGFNNQTNPSFRSKMEIT